MKKNNVYIDIFTTIYVAFVFGCLCVFLLDCKGPIIVIESVIDAPPIVLLFILGIIVLNVAFIFCLAIFPISIPLVKHYIKVYKTHYFINKNSKYETFDDIKKVKKHLDSYSISHISYLMDYKINYKRDISVSIMDLIENKYIIEDGKTLKVNHHKKLDDLLPSNRYLVDAIDNNKAHSINYKYYKELLKKELIDCGEMSYSCNYLNHAYWIFVNYVIIFVIFSLSSIGIISLNMLPPTTEFYEVVIDVLKGSCMIVITMDLLAAYGVLFYSINLFFHQDKYCISRTKKGLQLLDHVYGLNLYMSNFNYLSVSDVDQLTSWNRYYMYEIVLNVKNGTVRNFYNKYLKR